MKQIVVITDCHDVAFNEIRAQITSTLGNRIKNIQIEPVVKVKEFSLINCAFLTRLIAENYPPGTTIMILCSPTREKPNRIYGITKKKNIKFFATNNGSISWLLKDFGIKEVYISENRQDNKYMPFGGKIDYAPAIAKIAMVKSLKSLKMGKEANAKEIKKLNIPNNTILHIDNFGLCKIKSEVPNLKEGSKITISIKGKKFNATFCKRMMSLQDNAYAIYPGSSLNLPEFGIVRRNAAEILNLKIGDKIVW
jgi:S-adenosylmethionine hydrolase